MAESSTFPGTQTTDEHIRLSPLATFGETPDGRSSICFNPATAEHLIIVGPSGSGKTNVIETLAAAVRLQGHLTFAITTNRDALSAVAASTPTDAFGLLASIYSGTPIEFAVNEDDAGDDLLEHPDGWLTQDDGPGMPLVDVAADRMGNPQHTYVFIDDPAVFWGPQTDNPYQDFLNYLGSLVRKGAPSRLHLILAIRPEDRIPTSLLPVSDQLFLLGPEKPGHGSYRTGDGLDLITWLAPTRTSMTSLLNEFEAPDDVADITA